MYDGLKRALHLNGPAFFPQKAQPSMNDCVEATCACCFPFWYRRRYTRLAASADLPSPIAQSQYDLGPERPRRPSSRFATLLRRDTEPQAEVEFANLLAAEQIIESSSPPRDRAFGGSRDEDVLDIAGGLEAQVMSAEHIQRITQLVQQQVRLGDDVDAQRRQQREDDLLEETAARKYGAASPQSLHFAA
jgi:hypothetical protein